MSCKQLRSKIKTCYRLFQPSPWMKLLMDEKDINPTYPGEWILANHVTYLLVFSGGIQHSHMNEKLQLLWVRACLYACIRVKALLICMNDDVIEKTAVSISISNAYSKPIKKQRTRYVFHHVCYVPVTTPKKLQCRMYIGNACCYQQRKV
jgi:hypothetical protein